ncbi:MAG: hypothetical protein ACRDT4_17390 [Micromonosporaceae bacterium]
MTSEALKYLRALIREDIDAAEQFEQTMDGKSWQEAGGTGIDAAFQIAAKSRFQDRPLSEIVTWVASLRSELGDDASDADPALCEALIRAAVRSNADDLAQADPEAVAQTETVMAAKLAMESDFSDAELDAFLEKAETLAATWESQS